MTRSAPVAGQRPTLFVVATPIGNLEDITLRALRVLREVSVVAAEDTRRTGNLLRHYEIHTPLLSVHAHNEGQRLPQLIHRLEAGESIALVTDAGTPGISDPGARVVAGVRERGFRVEPIPGANSVATALSISGQTGDRFAFLGFIPNKAIARQKLWSRLADLHDFIVVLFEAPHRIQKTLAEMSLVFGNRPIMVARELTKAHEEVLSGSPSAVLEQLGATKGEFTILVLPFEQAANSDDLEAADQSDQGVLRVFGQLTETNGLSRREAIRSVATRTGRSSKDIFDALERAKIIGHSTE